VPRIKSWIKKVVSEREEQPDKEGSQSSKVAEDAAEAAKAAAEAAALVAKASQDLLSSRNEGCLQSILVLYGVFIFRLILHLQDMTSKILV
jgi:peroxin-14